MAEQLLRIHNVRLQDGELVLRPLTEDDWLPLARWNADEEVVYFADSGDKASYTLPEVQDIYRGASRTALCFMIEVHGRPVGEAWLQEMNLQQPLSLHPGQDLRRIDLCIGEKEMWGTGLGKRVIWLLTQFGFAHENADIIYGIISDYNSRSLRAFAACGYSLEEEVPEEPGCRAIVHYHLFLPRSRWRARQEALERLLADPPAWRKWLGWLDPNYKTWAGNRPYVRAEHVSGLLVLVNEDEGAALLLDEVTGRRGRALEEWVEDDQLEELEVATPEVFRSVRKVLTRGVWRHSRCYVAGPENFLPRPLHSVRELTAEDAEGPVMSSLLAREDLTALRDLDYVAEGAPVRCVGIEEDGELVGFCSANSICRGVWEISWIWVDPSCRRRGMASGMLTAQCRWIFNRGCRTGYYAGSSGDDLHRMVTRLGFVETMPSIRYIPATAEDYQWRAGWGREV